MTGNKDTSYNNSFNKDNFKSISSMKAKINAKKTIDYSNYYSGNFKSFTKNSFVKASNSNLRNNNDRFSYDLYKSCNQPRSGAIKHIKASQRNTTLNRRSCSSEKKKFKQELLHENTTKNPRVSHLFSKSSRNKNKHQSPIVDRGVLEELLVSSALLEQNSTVVNKVYQSKNKATSPKAATSRVPAAQPMGQASPKHNKSTKGRRVIHE